MRQRPTLPGRLQPSTIGVLRLNFCVRNGNRWNPQAITTAMGELFYVGFSTPAFAFASVFPPGAFPAPSQLHMSFRSRSLHHFFLRPLHASGALWLRRCTGLRPLSRLVAHFRVLPLLVLSNQLNQAIDLLVSSSCIHYCTSTDDLSTW